MDGLYMTKRNRAQVNCVNTYKCLITGIVIKSQCAYRLHRKNCECGKKISWNSSKDLGKVTHWGKEKEMDPKFAQGDAHIDGQWG